MAKKVEFFGGKTRKDSAEPFKRKMIPDKISDARKLFADFPEMDCSDVALQIGVSVNTLRKYLGDECWEANKRRMRKTLKRKTKDDMH